MKIKLQPKSEQEILREINTMPPIDKFIFLVQYNFNKKRGIGSEEMFELIRELVQKEKIIVREIINRVNLTHIVPIHEMVIETKNRKINISNNSIYWDDYESSNNEIFN